ncbi:DUF4340 domain-containing protein [Vacuolonema iberomarrocanum]|uniref:DUF4340 domain-containing protein n=1 Tax=Vacuolonema iberomarrocanum TaxID=3454632 RepID=UPI0019F3272E|nr:DUF4340 domain-containing protein [filamentous cyanobacterium LEGE 07170]
MQLKRQNILLVLTAFVLGGAVLLTRSPNDATTSDTTTNLFAFEERDIQALDIDTVARDFAFEKDENGIWLITEPEEAIANDATVAFLANLLATSSSNQTLSTTPDDISTYGLDRPFATVNITLEDGSTHQLVLGTFNFDQSRLYAQVDPASEAAEAAEEIDVLLVPADFETAINRPLEDWLPEEEEAAEPTEGEAEAATDTPEEEVEEVPSAEE